ncbi:MAG: hypothetical protein Q9178_007517 [Gyalolechia marmorata]
MIYPSDLVYAFAVILTHVIRSCYTCSCSYKDHGQREERRARNKKLKERPSQLPQRKRNLSELSLVSSTNATAPFLRLPPELRLVIYDLVMGNKRFKLAHVPKHIVLQTRLEQEVVQVRSGAMFKRVLNWNKQLYHLSLPLTCRQIYRESIDLLYSSNTFAFDDPHVLMNLATFCLPPQRLHAIRNLEVTWSQPQRDYNPMFDPAYDKIAWEECWTVITNKLQPSFLKIHLSIAYKAKLRDHPESVHDWLQPLLLLKQVASIELVWIATGPGLVPWEEIQELGSEVVGTLEANGNRVTSCVRAG